MSTPDGMNDEDSSRPMHGLRWGIKASFIDYLRRMPDGKGAVSDGALPVGENDVFFVLDAERTMPPEARTGSDSNAISWHFRGDARFSGHFGMLFVRIAHPRLEGSLPSAVLTIDDPDGTECAPRVALVTLNLERVDVQQGTEMWSGTNVALTAAGTLIFNEVYTEGEPFDSLTVQLPAP